MTTPTVIYPFDPTGHAVSNRIAGERQILTPPDWSDFYFILPAATPYFAESLTMTMQPSGKVLVEGIDYNPSHRFYDATIQCASPVYGSITFLDKTLSGVIEYNYQTLGGDWVINTQQAAQVLANTLLNPRTTTWEEVVDLPYQFPPVDHEWDIKDMTGAKDIVDVLDQMVQALQASGDQGLSQHLADFNNPHRVNKVQVGLGNVENFGLASVSDATTGSSNAKYMTPSTTQQAIIQFAVTPLNAHVTNTNNPHNVTKAHVGLGNVFNYGLASSADAAAGVVTVGYMTPALVATAISQQALVPLTSHLASNNNPHNVSKTQVGLSNVPNYPMASTVEAQAGVATDRLMSPALVKVMMQTGLGGNLQAHLDDHNNPHVVTKDQVGLGNVANFPVATTPTALAGSDVSSYMTPALTMAVVTAQLAPFSAHLSDTNNPHNVDAAQVGLDQVANLPIADDATAAAATDRESYMTPAGVGLAISVLAVTPLDNHLADTNNPHNVDATQVGLGNVANYPIADAATAVAGVDNASYMTPSLTAQAVQVQVGTDLAAHIASTSNPHGVNATQVGAYSIAETDAAILAAGTSKLDKTAQAADSALFTGKTVDDILALVTNITGVPTYFTYPAATLSGSGSTLWTSIATWTPPETPDPTHPTREFVGWIIGGEDRDQGEVPLYSVKINLRIDLWDEPYMEVVQHAGDPSTADRFVLTMDPTTSAITLWVKTGADRNPIALSISSDPGGIYATGSQLVTVEPADVVTEVVYWKYANPFTPPVQPDRGELLFAKNFSSSTAASTTVGAPSAMMVAAPLVQFINVATTTPEEDDAKLLAMPLKTEWRHFGRMSSLFNEPFHAQPTNSIWGWNDTLGAITMAGDSTLQTLLSPEAMNSSSAWVVEADIHVDDASSVNQRVGICLGQYVLYGRSVGLWALVAPATMAVELTVNAFQNDSLVLASGTATMDGATGARKGRMRVTFSPAGDFTVEVTPFVLEADTIGAYDAMVLSVNKNDTAVHAAWTAGMLASDSIRWGLAGKTGLASFVLLNWPDMFARYVNYAPGTDGTDNSKVMTYSGDATIGWNQCFVTDPGGLLPGRMIYSSITEQFYFSRRDSTLTPLTIVGSSPGGEILTT